MNDSTESPAGRISGLTATSIVVANMIGTGIFTSLGFQVGGLPSGFAILMLWLVGGVCAMCGALSYAELAAAMPRSGGEYFYLGRIYHPSLGFMAGWISATAGFAAPVALAAMAFGKYLTGVVPGVSPLYASLAVVWLVTPLLLGDSKLGSRFQNAMTVLKVALILGVIVAGCFIGQSQQVHFLPQAGDGKLIASTPFAVSLVYVMFAYSGWNASTYIAGELRKPGRMILLSVGLGTLLVTGLYLAVTAVFLRSTPLAEMDGKVEVALTAGPHLFGAAGTKIMAGFICLGLVSTVSAMMWIGPRVTVAMGEDLRGLRWFAAKNHHGTPVRAILAQFALVNLFLLTSSFEQVVSAATFILQLCAFLTVMGVFVLRWKRPELERPYRTWGYPVTPLVFMAVSVWMLWHLLVSKPVESLIGLGIAPVGLILYYASLPNYGPMSIKQALFSFKGRMSRSDYWIKGVVPILLFSWISQFCAYRILANRTGMHLVLVMFVIINVATFWPGLALLTKRLHDHNRSALFALTMLIPFVGVVFAIWILVEVWFLGGTVGPNRFGNDPVAPDLPDAGP